MENTIHCFVVDTIEVVISSFKGLVAVLFLPTIKWNRNQKFIYPPGLCNLSQIHFHHNHLSGWSKTQRIWKKNITSYRINFNIDSYLFYPVFIYLWIPFPSLAILFMFGLTTISTVTVATTHENRNKFAEHNTKPIPVSVRVGCKNQKLEVYM